MGGFQKISVKLNKLTHICFSLNIFGYFPASCSVTQFKATFNSRNDCSLRSGGFFFFYYSVPVSSCRVTEHILWHSFPHIISYKRPLCKSVCEPAWRLSQNPPLNKDFCYVLDYILHISWSRNEYLFFWDPLMATPISRYFLVYSISFVM